MCNPKFCINQAIKVTEGDFFLFFCMCFCVLYLIKNCINQPIKVAKGDFLYFSNVTFQCAFFLILNFFMFLYFFLVLLSLIIIIRHAMTMMKIHWLIHWCSIKHPDLASNNCLDKSSTYTANKRCDNIPPCLTLLEIMKDSDVAGLHLIHISCLLC